MTLTNAKVENVYIDELKERLAGGSLLLVDVREPTDDAAATSPARRSILSSISIPLPCQALPAGGCVRAHCPGGFAQSYQSVSRETFWYD